MISPQVPAGADVAEFTEELGRQMSQHESHTWSDAPVVIDAANVACSTELPGCGNGCRKCCWGRVDAIRQAWRDQIDPDATFVLVMDASKANQLGRDCKSKYERELNNGSVIVVDFADPEVLRIADENDAAVISRDGYKDFRREYPWIDGNRDQFFEWEVRNGWTVIVLRDMLLPSEFSKTQAEESTELKGWGLKVEDPEVKRLLRQTYRCDTENCYLRRYDLGHYAGVPNLQDPQQPRCRGCGKPLIVLGETPRLVQVKFANMARSETRRRTLAPGSSFVFGRESNDELASGVPGADLGLVSRQHARVEWDGSELSLTDLDSKNGTTVRRWAGKLQGYEPATRVEGTISLRRRDEVCLAGVLLITRSARSFMLAPQTATRRPTREDAPTVVRDGRGS